MEEMMKACVKWLVCASLGLGGSLALGHHSFSATYDEATEETVEGTIVQFLLRNPVPNGTFRSGFGMRRHPILGFSRMHTGVDWAAPRGTPIIAAGNGIVEKAGWDSGGYGNQTLIRHANGYVSSYNHQSAIAKNVTAGAKVVRFDRPPRASCGRVRFGPRKRPAGHVVRRLAGG
jgi:hypothetical protein